MGYQDMLNSFLGTLTNLFGESRKNKSDLLKHFRRAKRDQDPAYKKRLFKRARQMIQSRIMRKEMSKVNERTVSQQVEDAKVMMALHKNDKTSDICSACEHWEEDHQYGMCHVFVGENQCGCGGI